MIADSSFLVALFLSKDNFHKTAIDKFVETKGEIIILDRVLEETLTVIIYKEGVNYALEVLEKINKTKNFILYTINELEWSSTIQLITKIKKKISFIDFLVINVALNKHLQILCFDNQLNNIAKNLR